MAQKDYAWKIATFDDVDDLVKIYNSNPTFLENHLGASKISRELILDELDEMKEMGFVSELLIHKETGNILGFCDYKPGDCIYLSLLMLDGKLKGKGAGREIYQYMEERFRCQKAGSVRIDVVDDYEGHVLGFWEKQGFVSRKEITLEWHGKKSRAKMMKRWLNAEAEEEIGEEEENGKGKKGIDPTAT